MRSITPHAEEILGGTVVMQNMTGAVGAIALNYVADQDADGYTLLMSAENPMLYRVMGLGERDYGEFIPINLLARGTPMLVTRPGAPFLDYAGMMAYIAENPGEVRFGSTGPGGLPSVVTAMMQTVEGELDVTFVPYDGDGPALTALQGGAIDVMPAVLGAAIEPIRAGNLVPLAVFDTEPNRDPAEYSRCAVCHCHGDGWLPHGQAGRGGAGHRHHHGHVLLRRVHWHRCPGARRAPGVGLRPALLAARLHASGGAGDPAGRVALDRQPAEGNLCGGFRDRHRCRWYGPADLHLALYLRHPAAARGYELFFFQGVHAWAHFSGLALDEAALRRSLQEEPEVA